MSDTTFPPPAGTPTVTDDLDDDHPDDLATDVAFDDDLVAELVDVLDRTEFAVEPIEPFQWARLEPVRADRYRDALASWVDWLFVTYPISEAVLPVCWRQHPGLVEELSALWVSWNASTAEFASADAWVGWHDALDRYIGRCERRWNTGCTTSSHHAHAGRTTNRPQESQT